MNQWCLWPGKLCLEFSGLALLCSNAWTGKTCSAGIFVICNGIMLLWNHVHPIPLHVDDAGTSVKLY